MYLDVFLTVQPNDSFENFSCFFQIVGIEYLDKFTNKGKHFNQMCFNSLMHECSLKKTIFCMGV